MAYYNRGNACSWKKNYDMAIKDFDEAIRLNPNDALFYADRAFTWTKKKDFDKAINDYDDAIRLDPKWALAYYSRGIAWAGKKQYINAVRDCDEAIRLDPQAAVFYSDLAWLLATCPEHKVRDGNRAIQLATKACELTGWKNYFDLDTLAAAYAEAGQFDQAERYERKVSEDPACQGPAGEQFRQRLELYKQKKPYRESQ